MQKSIPLRSSSNSDSGIFISFYGYIHIQVFHKITLPCILKIAIDNFKIYNFAIDWNQMVMTRWGVHYRDNRFNIKKKQ